MEIKTRVGGGQVRKKRTCLRPTEAPAMLEMVAVRGGLEMLLIRVHCASSDPSGHSHSLTHQLTGTFSCSLHLALCAVG